MSVNIKKIIIGSNGSKRKAKPRYMSFNQIMVPSGDIDTQSLSEMKTGNLSRSSKQKTSFQKRPISQEGTRTAVISKLQPKQPSMIDHSKIGIVNRSLVANKNKHGKIFDELNTLD